MADEQVTYTTKRVTTVRGLEARTRAKLEADGWEFVEQQTALVRSTLVFRRVKRPIPRWVLIGSGAVIAALVVVIVIGSLTEGSRGTTAAPVPTVSVAIPTNEVTPTPSATPSPSAGPVTDSEVLATFNDYFAQRASQNVVIAKAVSEVTFSDGVLHVTFDPAHAGISQETFDQINPFPNGDMGKFVATPIAFNDATGNRIRPSVQSIVTTEADGTPLGMLDHAGILALNGLSQ